MNPIGIVGEVVGRIRQEVVVARFVGKFAVERTVAEIRRQIDEAPSGASSMTEGGDDAADRSRTPPANTEPAPVASPAADRRTDEIVPAVGDLALPDYDLLPAAHIVNALADLEPGERAAIEAYERAGRHRRTILGKLALLADVDEDAATR